ncbi:MAG: lytic murein transglycosylase [Alphaproteobacteria bacterium]|nr:lytic murein transglycosylase [Alphaproteobacteria bacterium]
MYTNYNDWNEEFRRTALRKSISIQTLDKTMFTRHILKSVISADKHQPEFRKDIQSYIDNSITNQRIKKAQFYKKKYHHILSKIEKEYGVQPEILIAFWAMETNFGNAKGDIPILDSLTTLAFDPRRSSFFGNELVSALKMIQSGVSENKMKGSWAGAFGNFQFMPSTYLNYAIDADFDGEKDLWESFPDAITSAANYLKSEGWKHSLPWGMEVFLPKKFNWNNVEQIKTIHEWIEEGIVIIDFNKNIQQRMFAKLYLPTGIQGPAFLTFSNFDVILKWNNSINYAIAVGHLADRIQGGTSIRKKYEKKNVDLSSKEAFEIQRLLEKFSLYSDKCDGVLGKKSREAIRNFQQIYDLPTDGYATKALLEFMKIVSENNPLNIKLSKTDVKNLQKILKKGKYYTGKIDGTLGKNTKKAIEKFKKSYGISWPKFDRLLLIKIEMQSNRNLEKI